MKKYKYRVIYKNAWVLISKVINESITLSWYAKINRLSVPVLLLLPVSDHSCGP